MIKKIIIHPITQFVLGCFFGLFLLTLIKRDEPKPKQPIDKSELKGSSICIFQGSNDQKHWVNIDTLTIRYK